LRRHHRLGLCGARRRHPSRGDGRRGRYGRRRDQRRPGGSRRRRTSGDRRRPSAFKREQAIAFGATHTFSTLEEALEPIRELTWGRLADKVIITVGQISGDHVTTAVETIGKGGTVALTSMGSGSAEDVKLKLYELALVQKSNCGGIFGGTSPRTEIPWLLNMYRDGKLKLDELVTRTYRLEEVNQGYDDLLAGKNLRGSHHLQRSRLVGVLHEDRVAGVEDHHGRSARGRSRPRTSPGSATAPFWGTPTSHIGSSRRVTADDREPR
jgi:hypothetical protein